MCLYSSKENANIAEEDIVCYKVLYQPYIFVKHYLTPYQYIEISNDIIDGKSYFIAKGEGNVIYDDKSRKYLVTDGYIHTYANLNMAEESLYLTANMVIFKCIIPKGTKFYVGWREDYASEKIKFIKKIG